MGMTTSRPVSSKTFNTRAEVMTRSRVPSASRTCVHFSGNFDDRGPLHVSAIDPKGKWLGN